MKRSLLSSCVLCLAVGCASADEGVASTFPLAGSVALPGGNTGGGQTGGTLGGSVGSTGGVGGALVDAGTPPVTPNTPVVVIDTTPGAVCSSDTVQTTRITPDMLIVFDRSLSMQTGSRWVPSVTGLKAITAALQSEVAFGLMMFPGGTSGTAQLDCFSEPNPFDCLALQALGGTGATCTRGSVNVPIARGNAMAIAQALDGTRPDGATPTAQTLAAAHAELGKVVSTPDAVAPPKYVILVTDGEPNCTNDSIGAGGSDPAAVAASVAAIQSMASDGIKTYVLGYGTQSNATTKAALDQMARAGGSGDTAHRPIENQAGLITAFQQITGGAVSCEYALAKVVSNKLYVRVTLDGKQLAVDDANGWVLSSDKRKVQLQGTACGALSSAAHLVNVTVECEPVPPVQ